IWTRTPTLDLSYASIPASPASGQTVSYFIKLTNTGNDTIANVSLTDLLPPSAQVTVATVNPPTAPPVGTVYTWTAATLLPGASMTVTITGTVGVCYTGLVTSTVTTTGTDTCG